MKGPLPNNAEVEKVLSNNTEPFKVFSDDGEPWRVQCKWFGWWVNDRTKGITFWIFHIFQRNKYLIMNDLTRDFRSVPEFAACLIELMVFFISNWILKKTSVPFFPKHGGLGGLKEAVLFMTTEGDLSYHHHLSPSLLLAVTFTVTLPSSSPSPSRYGTRGTRGQGGLGRLGD
jgi:hypothetical protein